MGPHKPKQCHSKSPGCDLLAPTRSRRCCRVAGFVCVLRGNARTLRLHWLVRCVKALLWVDHILLSDFQFFRRSYSIHILSFGGRCIKEQQTASHPHPWCVTLFWLDKRQLRQIVRRSFPLPDNSHVLIRPRFSAQGTAPNS